MNKLITLIIFIFLIVTPIILLLLPATFFNNKSTICMSVLLFNQNCYACGLTRATMHLIHFDFYKAWEYNPLSFITTPLISTIWIYYIYKYQKRLKSMFSIYETLFTLIQALLGKPFHKI